MRIADTGPDLNVLHSSVGSLYVDLEAVVGAGEFKRAQRG